MSKVLSFLNRNLTKIIWVFAILIWVGVGIYYFSTTRSSSIFQFLTPSKTPTPAVLESLENTHFIVANFQSWEEIEGSQDRYLLLTNPTTKLNYPKIKVVLEPRNPYENYEFWEGMTTFAVEKTEEEHDNLGYLKDFTPEEIDKLIKKGNLIKVVFEKESNIKKFEEEAEELEAKDLKGKTDDYLALSLLIKRTEGKIAVEQELGRKI